jgi:hypothetical protein
MYYLDLMDPMHIWIYLIILIFLLNSALVNVDGQPPKKEEEEICNYRRKNMCTIGNS